jgi:spore maturation protein B
MVVTRPLTGSGSAGIMLDLIARYGEDSLIVKMAATMYGSSETTFYVIAVYFGAVNIRKTRHAVPAGLIADGFAAILSVYVVRWLMG